MIEGIQPSGMYIIISDLLQWFPLLAANSSPCKREEHKVRGDFSSHISRDLTEIPNMGERVLQDD